MLHAGTEPKTTWLQSELIHHAAMAVPIIEKCFSLKDLIFSASHAAIHNLTCQVTFKYNLALLTQKEIGNSV